MYVALQNLIDREKTQEKHIVVNTPKHFCGGKRLS